MNVALTVGAVAIAAGLLYWFPIRSWYRRSDAGRLDRLRTMSGDADLLCPDHESTLTIAIEAESADVWPALLQMGRGRRSQRTAKELSELKPGDVIQVSLAPPFPIAAIDPPRTLVLGAEHMWLQWRWQFELYALDVSRTRLISRARIRAGRTLASTALALALQPISFVIMRKMLFDVKRRAERLSESRGRSRPAA